MNDASSVPATSILIGKTSATSSDMPTGNQYLVKVEDNGRIQVSASNYYGYRAALDFLAKEFEQYGGIFTGVYSGEANINYVDRASSDSIRVMFYNVFGWNNWPKASYNENGQILQQNGQPATSNSNVYKPSQAPSNAPPEALRQALQSDLVGAYAPDVIGFQEYVSDDIWLTTSMADYHDNFTSVMEELGYTKVGGSDLGPKNDAKRNCTPIFYNAEKLTLVEYGFTLYRSTNDPDQAIKHSLSSLFEKKEPLSSKGVTWAIFEELDENGQGTGKLFSVFNTHFAHESGSVGDNTREDNAIEFLEVMSAALSTKPEYNNIPVIMGGDLNFWNIWGNYDKQTSEEMIAQRESETKPYTALVNGGMTFAAYLSGVTTNGINGKANHVESYHGYSSYNTTTKTYDTNKSTLFTGYTLDYIFVENESGMTVKKYIIVEDDASLRGSDHSPTFVDFVLN